MVFNSNGYTSSDTRALGKTEQETTTFVYYPDNLLSSVTDQLSRVTAFSYDADANPTSVLSIERNLERDPRPPHSTTAFSIVLGNNTRYYDTYAKCYDLD